MAALFCFTIWMLVVTSHSISSKLDFDETDSSSVATNSTQVNDEDVEVKHTIVVSTKLKNNNRRGLHSSSDADSGTLSYNIGRTSMNKDEDSSEVPIVYGMKAVGSTQIRTPDTRLKNKVYPDAVFINRNIRDDYDHYPNSATNPMAWKPSNFFNNINWRGPDNDNQVFNSRPNAPGNVKFHRKITDDGMKEFYCRKCREYSRGVIPGQRPNGCAPVQRRNAWIYETTTPKIKIDDSPAAKKKTEIKDVLEPYKNPKNELKKKSKPNVKNITNGKVLRNDSNGCRNLSGRNGGSGGNGNTDGNGSSGGSGLSGGSGGRGMNGRFGNGGNGGSGRRGGNGGNGRGNGNGSSGFNGGSGRNGWSGDAGISYSDSILYAEMNK